MHTYAQDTLCCSYTSTASNMKSKGIGYDCVHIPGASSFNTANGPDIRDANAKSNYCGRNSGLGMATSVCSELQLKKYREAELATDWRREETCC